LKYVPGVRYELERESSPNCILSFKNEPNYDLMAEAFINLYYRLKLKGTVD
jgi:hypothetical protein